MRCDRRSFVGSFRCDRPAQANGRCAKHNERVHWAAPHWRDVTTGMNRKQRRAQQKEARRAHAKGEPHSVFLSRDKYTISGPAINVHEVKKDLLRDMFSELKL